MSKIKIFRNSSYDTLEDKVNEFIDKKDVIEIKFIPVTNVSSMFKDFYCVVLYRN